nr:hypothetical protein [Euzebyales bacterium]
AYTTGDAARREFDGSVTFLGRLDPVVSVSGQLVAAGEVRDVLREHPFVADAVVVDQPDPRSGQAVLACVVLTGDAPSAETVAGQLRRHVYDTLGGLAFPRTVVIVDALPDGVPRRTLRRALRMVAAAHHSATIMLPAGQLEAAIAVAGQRQPHDMISDAPGKEPRRHEP